MSSNTLSAVLEKKIRRLCLSDFPCGEHRWKKKKEKKKDEEEEEEEERKEDAGETESTDALLDLLSCPHSPWRRQETWSPQAAALKRLAVLKPRPLHADFIHTYFTTLRIVNCGVSVVDGGLLKFSRLQELVLSANQISEVPAENLPATLKVLELCANQLSSLSCLISRPRAHLHHLYHLGLSGNHLGSSEDASHLTGTHWPQLVSLDLSDCEFQDQKALLKALTSLPRLRTLVLEGNPLTLTSSYPGFTVDSLPLLSCLDSSWISPEERHHFEGLAAMSDLIVDVAAATVSVGVMRGIPDPSMRVDEKTPDFPVVTYGYLITYDFPSHHTTEKKEFKSEPPLDDASTACVTEGGSSVTEQQSDSDRPASTGHAEASLASTETTYSSTARVCEHGTQVLPWSKCFELNHTQTYTITSLQELKKFLNQGLCVRLVEQKILSWPAVPDESSAVKSAKEKKGAKDKNPPVKSTSQDQKKKKKKKGASELVQDPPVRMVLCSAHVSLQNLVRGGQRVSAVCDLGVLHDPELKRPPTPHKEAGKKTKEDKKKEKKKKEDKEEKKEDPKRKGGDRPKNSANKKAKGGKGQDPAEDVVETVTVELSVELHKWRSACDARQLLLPQQNP